MTIAAHPDSVGREVLFEVDGHVATVVLNRPDKRNAINGAVTQAMSWILDKIEADPDIRVAILTSSIDSTFSAGADLAEIAKGNAASLSTEKGGFAGFANYPRTIPMIAAVTGNALAGGCELALACDMIVADPGARFGLPEVKRGLFAAANGVFRLVRALPRNIAIEVILSGDPISAQRAFDLGLINRIAPTEDVRDEARKLADAIAVNAPLSVRESLRVARLAFDLDEDGLREESRKAAATTFSSDDAREGPRAFLEKRPPVWKGR